MRSKLETDKEKVAIEKELMKSKLETEAAIEKKRLYILSPYKEKNKLCSPLARASAISDCSATKCSCNCDMFSKPMLFSLAETGP